MGQGPVKKIFYGQYMRIPYKNSDLCSCLAAALKQLEASEQFSNELVSHFHEEFTRWAQPEKSRKQQEAERDALFG